MPCARSPYVCLHGPMAMVVAVAVAQGCIAAMDGQASCGQWYFANTAKLHQEKR
ncbi:MAG: hypothetical protein ORN29_03055 [Rhodoferax sp.]|nr:hypothetical protein [Rhodoferax sp.]